MSVDAETVELLNSLVALSPRSQRDIADAVGWSQSAMNGALKGQRSFPASRVLPLLDAVGIGPDMKPLPGTVWYGVCEQSDVEQAVAVLKRFISGDCNFIELVRSPAGKTSASGRVSLARFNEVGETLIAFSAPSDNIRGMLRIIHEPDLSIDEARAPPDAEVLAKALGAQFRGRVELPRADFKNWTGKEAVSADEFDRVTGRVVPFQAPTWDDVQARIAELMSAGADPARVLRSLR